MSQIAETNKMGQVRLGERISKVDVIAILERERISAVKLKWHCSDYTDNLLYNIIELIKSLPNKATTKRRTNSVAQEKNGSEWISVKDSLPENYDWVRVCINGKPTVVPHIYDANRWYAYASCEDVVSYITHWKPFNDDLPK